MSKHIDFVADARGLGRPMPVVKARQWIPLVPPGGLLEVLATDPDSVEDILAWTQTSNNPLVDLRLGDGVYHFLIQRASTPEDASATMTETSAAAA